jgi:poly [ADP-ribose] polymerase
MGNLKVEARSHHHVHGHGEEEKVMTRKQKAESKAQELEHAPKKAKVENEDGHTNGKSASNVLEEYDEFCKATNEKLSLEQMKEILEANGLDSSGSDLEITRRWLV